MRTGWATWPGRGLAVLVAALSLAVVATTPAAAHDVLLSTAPSDRQVVTRVPSQVVLTFNAPALAIGTEIVVTGPTGQIQAGPSRLVDNTVTEDLSAGSPAGRYTVAWRVTSADGHPVWGSFGFTAKVASLGRPATPVASPLAPGPIPASGSHQPVGIWLIVALVVAITAITVVWRISRHSQSGPSKPSTGT